MSEATETKPTASPAKPERRAEHKLPTAVLGMDVSPDGATLYAACMHGVYRVDAQSGEHERLATHDSYVSGVALDVDRETLISAGYDGALAWIRAANGEVIRRVQAHQFWSWRMALARDASIVATVTGQYLAGDYEYKPAPENEPSVKVFDAETGELRHAFSHVPSVQAVAISPDAGYVAAGNLMGEVRVWDLEGGSEAARFSTDAFTSWGIIKSHCYIGGIYAMHFTPDGEHLLLTGMGPMRDPMAGNGRQLWQKFAWRENPPRMVDETHRGESGEGLMESLAVHPAGDQFVMAGRLRGGDYSAGLFDLDSGKLVGSEKTDYRVTRAVYSPDGKRLMLAGAANQPNREKGRYAAFGRIGVYELVG
ncbi:MAG: hypothetical protein WDZ59_12650 [Pirellulales bacterium]